MTTDTDMHDGSPMGNAHVNAELYGDMTICPEGDSHSAVSKVKCGSSGGHFKCYRACFAECVTYLKRTGLTAFVPNSTKTI